MVAPRGGTVKAVQYQAGGAGHYIVLTASGEDRDYVFMHLKSGSIPVVQGQTVRTGQQDRPGRQHRPLVGAAPALRDLDRRRLVHRREADRPAAAAEGLAPLT